MPRKLFLLNVEDIDAVARLFNGSICYELAWKSVLEKQTSGKRTAQALVTDEQLLIASYYLFQTKEGVPITTKGRVDIAVVLNPGKRYLSMRHIWLTYSAAIYVGGAGQARRLHNLAHRFLLNETLMEFSDDIRGTIDRRDIRKYAPFVGNFLSSVKADRKSISVQFTKQFLI